MEIPGHFKKGQRMVQDYLKMFQGIFYGVSRRLEGCFNGVLWVLRVSPCKINSVSRIFQRSPKGVSKSFIGVLIFWEFLRKCKGCFKSFNYVSRLFNEVSSLPQRNFKFLSSEFQCVFMNVSKMLQESCKDISRVL